MTESQWLKDAEAQMFQEMTKLTWMHVPTAYRYNAVQRRYEVLHNGNWKWHFASAAAGRVMARLNALRDNTFDD